MHLTYIFKQRTSNPGLLSFGLVDGFFHVMIQNICTFQIQLARLPFSKLGRKKIWVGSRFLIYA